MCLIDFRMPDGGGITATETICRALPATKVVLMTATPDEEGAVAAARAGADGYLAKDVDPRRRLTHGLLRAVWQADPERLGT